MKHNNPVNRYILSYIFMKHHDLDTVMSCSSADYAWQKKYIYILRIILCAVWRLISIFKLKWGKPFPWRRPHVDDRKTYIYHWAWMVFKWPVTCLHPQISSWRLDLNGVLITTRSTAHREGGSMHKSCVFIYLFFKFYCFNPVHVVMNYVYWQRF